MLRAALPLSRRAVIAPIASKALRQWQGQWTIGPSFAKSFAEVRKPGGSIKSSIKDSDAPVFPGSQSRTATAVTPPPPGPVASVSPGRLSSTPATPSSSTIIPPANVPLMPPPPPSGKVQTTPPTSIPPPPEFASSKALPPPPPPKRKPRRFRRFVLGLILLTGLAYGGGVWYSLISDNFHDFFTEYIPFGEDAVFYFEEREFRKRFPRATNPGKTPRDTGQKITIPSKSGLSWKIAEDEGKGSDLGKKGPHMSAVEKYPVQKDVAQAQQAPTGATGKEKTKAVEVAKRDAPKPSDIMLTTKEATSAQTPSKTDAQPKPLQEQKVEPSPKIEAPAKKVNLGSERGKESKKSGKTKEAPTKNPEVDEPSVFVPITRIDPLKIKNADEPLVQTLVRILNDIITVVNADNSNGKFNSTITKAKTELANVGRKIMDLKAAERAAAEEKVKSLQGEFDKAARELVRRLEDEMHDQEGRWKDEFESEREKIAHTYEERLKLEVERTKQLSEQRVQNQLLEQAVALKTQFLAEVKDRVETERDGRLSKLSELAGSVNELEKLTSDWNSVIDANLKTQYLQVAVEAVRAGLESSDRPRPFIKELAALKEIAAGDPVVDSAIASVNPIAYQLGVPTSGQLIDRFRRVATEVRKASLLPEDAGVASHAASLILSKVLFKKQGRAVGDDVESVLTRAETLLEEGDLDEAAREVNTLTGWAKKLSSDWLAEVRRVLEVRQALDVIATEARLQSLKVD